MISSSEGGGYSSRGSGEVNGEEKWNEENSGGPRAEPRTTAPTHNENNQAALADAAASLSSQRTETSFDTPGSCMVTP